MIVAYSRLQKILEERRLSVPELHRRLQQQDQSRKTGRIYFHRLLADDQAGAGKRALITVLEPEPDQGRERAEGADSSTSPGPGSLLGRSSTRPT